MRKPRIVGRGASSNEAASFSLRAWRQFFANSAVKKNLTAEVAKNSRSPQSATRELKCIRHRLRAVRVALAVVGLVGVAVAQAKQEVDLIVDGGIVVAMDGARRILHDGSVAVKGDAIVAVGPQADVDEQYHGAQTIDARGRLVLPGFINGHTHVPMTLLRGLHDDVTLNDWLYKYIFPAEAKNVNEEFVRWGTRLAAAEQIRSGVTTFADMYYFEDAVAEETKAAGMRGVLGETFIDFPAPDK